MLDTKKVGVLLAGKNLLIAIAGTQLAMAHAWVMLGLVAVIGAVGNVIAVYGKPLAASSGPPPIPPAPAEKGSIPLHVMLVLGIFGIVLAGLLFGCSASTKGAIKQAGADFKTCETGKLPATVQSIIEQVTSDIWNAGQVGWQDELAGLAIRVGTDTVNCAVMAVQQDIIKRFGHGQMEQSSRDALARAQKWLKAHGGK